MTVLRYMAEQRDRIRSRHCGEEFFFQSAGDKNAPVRAKCADAESILAQIDAMKGLNVEGRRLNGARRAESKQSAV